MAIAPEVARYLGRKYGRRLVGDYDPEDPLGEAMPAPVAPPQDTGDELATPEEMRPPAPPVPGGLKVSDGPDMEPDGDADDSAHLATLATASRPPLRTAPTPDESWGTYGDAKGLSAARASDRDSMLATMLQRAGRQVISGLTRTPEAETIAAPADAEKRYLGAQAAKREAMLKALKDAREGRVADADVEFKLAEAEKARRLPVAPAAKPDHFSEEEANKDRRLRESLSAAEQRARIAASAAAKAKEDGKQLPATVAEGLGDSTAAAMEAEKTLDSFNRLGMAGAVAKMSGAATDALDLRSTDAAQYLAEIRPAIQAVGTILEGGKLAAGDEVKYRKMFPQAGDTPQQAAAKVEGIKRILAEKSGQRTQALGAAGYKVPKSAVPASGGDDKVVVSNGKETVRIPAARLKDAERDGFRRVQ